MDCIRLDAANRAAEIWPDTAKTALVFHADVLAQIVEVESGTVQVGQTWNGEGFDPLPEPPAPARRMVPKSVIIARLIAANKIAAAKAALDADVSAYARWWAPDRPAIYHDDPEALALLAAIGADAEAIMAPEEAGD